MERDTRIRKRIKAIYNKTEADFETALAFRNYEEELEDIIFNLVHELDVDKTKAQIERYQRENEEDIVFNQSRRVELEGRIEREFTSQKELQQNRLKEAHVRKTYKKTHTSAKQLSFLLLFGSLT